MAESPWPLSKWSNLFFQRIRSCIFNHTMTEGHDHPIDLSMNMERENVIRIRSVEEINMLLDDNGSSYLVQPQAGEIEESIYVLVAPGEEIKINIQVENGPKMTQRTVSSQTEFQCSICPFSCIRRQDFREHMKFHNEVKSYQCYYCPFTSMNITNLRRHLHHHENSYPYKCDLCSYSSRTSGCVTRHRRIHSEDQSNNESSRFNSLTDPIELRPQEGAEGTENK